MFELNFKEGMIRIERHFVSSQTIYHVVFSDKRSPLVVTRALTDNASHWWTSIPEGRRKEAEEIWLLKPIFIPMILIWSKCYHDKIFIT